MRELSNSKILGDLIEAVTETWMRRRSRGPLEGVFRGLLLGHLDPLRTSKGVYTPVAKNETEPPATPDSQA